MIVTRFTRLFPCSLPIMGAPMAGCAGGQLAVEVCRAGGLGFVAAGTLDDLEGLDKEISILQETEYPLCLGFITYAAVGQNKDRFRQVMEKYRPSVVQFFAPALLDDNVALAQSYGSKVITQVGTFQEAADCLEAGVDGLIVQGSEAGGHGVSQGSGTLSFCRTVMAKLQPSVPVLAAGGIMDGAGLAAALSLGCDGVVLGTRLWACEEAQGSRVAQERLVQAKSCDDVIRTKVYDKIGNSFSKYPWPDPFDSVGALRNNLIDKWHGNEKELQANIEAVAQDFKAAKTKDGYDAAVVLSGEGVGLAERIEKAAVVVENVHQEAEEQIKNLSKLLS